MTALLLIAALSTAPAQTAECPECPAPPRLKCSELLDRAESRCEPEALASFAAAHKPKGDHRYATVRVYEPEEDRGNWFIPLTAGYLRGTFGAAGIGYQWANRWSLAGQAVYGQVNGIDGSASCTVDCYNCVAPFVGETTHELGGAVTLSIPLP